MKVCFSYLSYPDVSWWDDIVTAFEVVKCIFIVAIYLMLPSFSGTVVDLINCNFLTVAIDNLEERQQDIVRRVRRLLSLLALAIFVQRSLDFWS